MVRFLGKEVKNTRIVIMLMYGDFVYGLQPVTLTKNYQFKEELYHCVHKRPNNRDNNLECIHFRFVIIIRQKQSVIQ